MPELDVALVRSLVADTRFADVRYVARTESTNADAAALLGTPGVTIVADEQRAGVGRRGRRWIAPAGSSLLFTTILPELASDALWGVPLWCALAVADAIDRICGPAAGDLALQWPNDILLGERKVCGILCVSRVTGSRASVGCGVGINVHRPARRDADADDELSRIVPAPAFLSDRVPAVRREPLLAEILRRFDAGIPAHGDPDAIARAWERRAALDGTPYRLLVDGEGELDAVARRIAPGGALVVAVGGHERPISLADARVLRGG